jgi:hypothetical protein
MENPANKEVIDALNTILEGNMLSDQEKEFIIDCINNSTPIDFLQKSLLDSDQNAISIYSKLEKYYNEIEENKL